MVDSMLQTAAILVVIRCGFYAQLPRRAMPMWMFLNCCVLENCLCKKTMMRVCLGLGKAYSPEQGNVHVCLNKMCAWTRAMVAVWDGAGGELVGMERE